MACAGRGMTQQRSGCEAARVHALHRQLARECMAPATQPQRNPNTTLTQHNTVVATHLLLLLLQAHELIHPGLGELELLEVRRSDLGLSGGGSNRATGNTPQLGHGRSGMCACVSARGAANAAQPWPARVALWLCVGLSRRLPAARAARHGHPHAPHRRDSTAQHARTVCCVRAACFESLCAAARGPRSSTHTACGSLLTGC